MLGARQTNLLVFVSKQLTYFYIFWSQGILYHMTYLFLVSRDGDKSHIAHYWYSKWLVLAISVVVCKSSVWQSQVLPRERGHSTGFKCLQFANVPTTSSGPAPPSESLQHELKQVQVSINSEYSQCSGILDKSLWIEVSIYIWKLET